MLRALQILESFDGRGPTLSLSDIAQEVGLTLPTTHRLLRALVSRDFVVVDTDTRRFAIGPAVVRLTRTLLRRDDLVAVAMPGLERLLELTRESVGLHCRFGTHRVCLVELASPQPIRMASGIGLTQPIYAGAAGKAMLAWGGDKVFEEATAGMRRLAMRRPREPKQLRAELARIRKAGYATSFGETVPGAAALAAPILSPLGEVIAAVNITGPADRWTRERIRRAAPALQRETALIMRRLGREVPAVADDHPRSRR